MIDEIFQEILNISSIADDILIVGYDSDCRQNAKMSNADMSVTYLKIKKICVISDAQEYFLAR